MRRTPRPAPARLGLVALLLLWGSRAAGAQRLAAPEGSRVRQALEFLRSTEPQTIEEQIQICQIEAPPFGEARRAEDYRRRMETVGLEDVRIDAEGNVIGVLRGTGRDATAVMISGHLDTVFPEGTDVRVRREGTVLRGPGIGDDCRGLAVVLAAARAMREAGIRPRRDVYFVGTVGEEGLGNLRGVRHLFSGELRQRVGYFISVDHHGYEITKDAVGSHRYRVTYSGPGGHSYTNFGRPNPAHALGRAIARLADLELPAAPKVTLSVGIVAGGTSVNAIPQRASMDVDMRSENQAALTALDGRFNAVVREALVAENGRSRDSVQLAVRLDTLGIRPGGSQPESAPVVQAGFVAARRLGVQPTLSASSTDANVPISLGIPGVAIGAGGVGRNTHSLEETWDTRDSHLGTQWVLLYLLTLANSR